MRLNEKYGKAKVFSTRKICKGGSYLNRQFPWTKQFFIESTIFCYSVCWSNNNACCLKLFYVKAFWNFTEGKVYPEEASSGKTNNKSIFLITSFSLLVIHIFPWKCAKLEPYVKRKTDFTSGFKVSRSPKTNNIKLAFSKKKKQYNYKFNNLLRFNRYSHTFPWNRVKIGALVITIRRVD